MEDYPPSPTELGLRLACVAHDYLASTWSARTIVADSAQTECCTTFHTCMSTLFTYIKAYMPCESSGDPLNPTYSIFLAQTRPYSYWIIKKIYAKSSVVTLSCLKKPQFPPPGHPPHHPSGWILQKRPVAKLGEPEVSKEQEFQKATLRPFLSDWQSHAMMMQWGSNLKWPRRKGLKRPLRDHFAFG